MRHMSSEMVHCWSFDIKAKNCLEDTRNPPNTSLARPDEGNFIMGTTLELRHNEVCNR